MFYVLKVLRVFILALRATHKSGAKVLLFFDICKKIARRAIFLVYGVKCRGKCYNSCPIALYSTPSRRMRS